MKEYHDFFLPVQGEIAAHTSTLHRVYFGIINNKALQCVEPGAIPHVCLKLVIGKTDQGHLAPFADFEAPPADVKLEYLIAPIVIQSVIARKIRNQLE